MTYLSRKLWNNAAKNNCLNTFMLIILRKVKNFEDVILANNNNSWSSKAYSLVVPGYELCMIYTSGLVILSCSLLKRLDLGFLWIGGYVADQPDTGAGLWWHYAMEMSPQVIFHPSHLVWGNNLPWKIDAMCSKNIRRDFALVPSSINSILV